jgi:hypothetical protein
MSKLINNWVYLLKAHGLPVYFSVLTGKFSYFDLKILSSRVQQGGLDE